MPRWRELPLPDDIEKLAARVRGIAIAVHREVGAGFRESIYQRCLAHALREAGHEVQEFVPIAVRFRGLILERAGIADILIDGKLVVEVKAREAIAPAHEAQVVGYIRALDLPLGLLLNFHAPNLVAGGKRVVHPRFLEVVE